MNVYDLRGSDDEDVLEIIHLQDQKPNVPCIVIKDKKKQECILKKRYNSQIEQYEYLVKYKNYPIENSEWLLNQDIFKKKLIKKFEKKLQKSETISRKVQHRYHHIGQNQLQQFINNAKYLANNELKQFSGKVENQKKVQMCDIDQSFNDSSIEEINQLFKLQ